MGCSESKDCTVFLCWEGIVMGKQVYGSRSITTTEYEIDLTSFSPPKRILGIGGFGMVRAVTKLTGTDRSTAYALKSLSKSAVLQRSSGTAAVLSELKALALLVDAKFICNVHYAFQDSIFLYMIIDLAAGGDLRFALKFSSNCRFNEVRARFYIAQIIIAVDSCHSASILHRDIKPENILLQANGYLLLSDFGVAKILQDVEDCRSTSGTHGYMAPEIYLPHHRHGTAADWFALGVTLHEFVTGRRPFETSKLQAFRNGEANAGLLSLAFLESCNYISESCKDFIAGLLVPKPSRRLGSYRGIEEMKQHSWLGGFDWVKLVTQSLPAPYKPDTSFDRTDVKGENMRKAVYDHINSKTISPADQYHFQSYEYHRRYYSCREYESSYLQTKATASINSPLAVSSIGAGHGATFGHSTERIDHVPKQSNPPIRRSVSNGVGQKIPPAADAAVRDGRNSEMVWTLKSSLVRDSVIPKSVKSGGSANEDHRRSQNNRGDRHRDKLIDKGTDSQLMRDHLLLQPQKSNKDNKDACDNKNIHTDSVRTAVATGGINASAASVKFMANHIRPTGSKNYVRHQHQHQQQQQNLMEIEQLNNVMHSADPGQQPVLSSRHGTSGNMSSLERIGEGGAVGLTSLGFKSQKDKRQKLDVAPYNLDLPNENFRCDQSSCSIRPKSGHLESLYGIHHQYNVLRPPQIVTKKCPEVEEKFFPETNVVVNAVDAASVGVRNFHGLTHIPNISDEEGDAADWLGHAMSSTSQPVEVSLESSRVTKDTTKKDGSLGSADSADVSDHVFPGQKWGGNSLDAPKSTTQTARGPHRYSTEVALPHDSAVSYRDQVILSEVRSRNPSRIVSSLVLRNECCKKLDEIIKSTAAVKHADWPSDQKRTGWNSDSQDGENASVSIVSPDATDNKELALPESST